ncbi:DUF806 family protein [Lactiplantibacillus pentosus]|uniref:DUF806 family protein n=1 Tax=Lactiplantibacillus pentosus TaxID=1589 RepID=UPI001FD67BC9|nr:DUF806 family protein [Lactiplantibacillus pentosus]MCJ8184808.1 DUF806 family protein [Lactiplantibacillus pentosus]
MTPASKVVALLKENATTLVDIDAANIHAFKIADSDWVDDAPIILVTEIDVDPYIYGNGVAVKAYDEIQIQFYYPADYDQDMNTIEESLKVVMFQNGYHVFSIGGHAITPDTKNTIQTIKFRKSN